MTQKQGKKADDIQTTLDLAVYCCLKELNASSHFLCHRFINEMPQERSIRVLEVIREVKYHNDIIVTVLLDGSEILLDDKKDDFLLTLDVAYQPMEYMKKIEKLLLNADLQTYITFYTTCFGRPAWRFSCVRASDQGDKVLQ